jgi:hypothetical protein
MCGARFPLCRASAATGGRGVWNTGGVPSNRVNIAAVGWLHVAAQAALNPPLLLADTEGTGHDVKPWCCRQRVDAARMLVALFRCATSSITVALALRPRHPCGVLCMAKRTSGVIAAVSSKRQYAQRRFLNWVPPPRGVLPKVKCAAHMYGISRAAHGCRSRTGRGRLSYSYMLTSSTVLPVPGLRSQWPFEPFLSGLVAAQGWLLAFCSPSRRRCCIRHAQYHNQHDAFSGLGCRTKRIPPPYTAKGPVATLMCAATHSAYALRYPCARLCRVRHSSSTDQVRLECRSPCKLLLGVEY